MRAVMEPVEGLQALPVVEAAALGEEAASTVVQPVGKERRSQVCLLYTSPSPRDRSISRMPSSA